MTSTELERVEAPSSVIGCQSVHGCERTATWVLVVFCCDVLVPLCSEHKQKFMRLLRDALALGIPISCGYCEMPWDSENPWAHMAVRPL